MYIYLNVYRWKEYVGHLGLEYIWAKNPRHA
jgi:hypothetical protein